MVNLNKSLTHLYSHIMHFKTSGGMEYNYDHEVWAIFKVSVRTLMS